MKADIKGFFDEATYTVSYVIADPKTGDAAILDPVLDYDPASGKYSTRSADKILAFVREKNLKVTWILETHVHADHLTASAYLQEQFNAPLGIGEDTRKVQAFFKGFYNAEAAFKTDGSQFDHLFKDGEVFRIGDMEGRVLATPGHTLACVTYVVGDAAFVGDTLFMTDYGTARTDFPGGDASALYDSIHRLYGELPPETRLFLCHDYGAPGREEFVWETPLAEQRKKNVHIHEGVSKDAFIKLRQTRDKGLAAPRLILPAIQVNMRAGSFPPQEANGVSYLKIPVRPAEPSR